MPENTQISQSSEAPAVVFTQLYAAKDGQVIQFNLTVRDVKPEAAIDRIMAGIAYAKEHYGLSLLRPDASIPGPAKQDAATASSAPAAPAPSNGQDYSSKQSTIHAVKMEVTPSADGKVTMKWFTAGHQYPDITTTRTEERAIELLCTTGKWEASHLQRAQTFQVKHKIIWRESEKKNSSGKPYKDIISLLPE